MNDRKSNLSRLSYMISLVPKLHLFRRRKNGTVAASKAAKLGVEVDSPMSCSRDLSPFVAGCAGSLAPFFAPDPIYRPDPHLQKPLPVQRALDTAGCQKQ